MNSLPLDMAAGLLDAAEAPCLSLYLPTHRRHPERQQDPLRFRNLVKALETSLQRKFPKQTAQPLLEPFRALAADTDFWNHNLEGLAVLGAQDVFRVYRLQRPMPELAVVAESFHIKPLLRILQSADRYQVLGLDRQAIRIFEGNRDALDEIEPAPGVPRTLVEALGGELTEPHLAVESYGGVGPGTSAMHHGHGDKSAEQKIDAERFFRAVARAVREHHSQPSGLPLILATLPEHRRLFHEVSDNPALLQDGIDVHPDALSPDELRQRAWQVIEPRYLARLAGLVEEFHNARGQDAARDDLRQVAQAVVAGRVATLLIEAERVLPGRLQADTGEIETGELIDPDVDDVLDDLAALTRKRGGEVVIVPRERMPSDTGIAAIYRY